MKNNTSNKGFCIDRIPELLAENKISRLEAISKIAEDVMNNPLQYRIKPEEEDLRSELSIRLMQTGHFILDRYKKEYCAFSTYVNSFVHYQVLNICREKRKAYEHEYHIEKMESLKMEEAQERYSGDEYSSKISKFRYAPKAILNKVPYRQKTRPITEQELSILSKNQENPLSFIWKHRKSKEARTALILALKSSYYLSEHHILEISKFCNIPHEILCNSIQKIKEKLDKKQNRLQQIQASRDMAFQLHVKFQKELSKTENQSSPHYSAMLQKYQKLTERWYKKNEQLQTNGVKICPTNKHLAKELGICERSVCHYMQNAESIFKNIKMLLKEENDG